LTFHLVFLSVQSSFACFWFPLPLCNARKLAKNGHPAQNRLGNAVAQMSEITELLAQMSVDNPGATSELIVRGYVNRDWLVARAWLRGEIAGRP